MQKYRSFKVVEAFRIYTIENPSDDEVRLVGDGVEETVDVGWFVKHGPEVGGYFVRYQDGYRSYSPAEAFASGYRLVEAPSDELANRFRYHAPTPAARALHNQITEATLELAAILDALVPESIGKATAIQKLEECRMWANQAIATNHDKLGDQISKT